MAIAFCAFQGPFASPPAAAAACVLLLFRSACCFCPVTVAYPLQHLPIAQGKEGSSPGFRALGPKLQSCQSNAKASSLLFPSCRCPFITTSRILNRLHQSASQHRQPRASLIRARPTNLFF